MPRISVVATDPTSGVKYSMEVEYGTVDKYGQNKVYIAVPDASQDDGVYLYEVSANVDNVGSKNGVNNGRISKLNVRDIQTNAAVVVYDCGWHREPSCFLERVIVSALLEIFDTPCRSSILTDSAIQIKNSDGVKYVDGCPNAEPEQISEADYYKKLREFKF